MLPGSAAPGLFAALQPFSDGWRLILTLGIGFFTIVPQSVLLVRFVSAAKSFSEEASRGRSFPVVVRLYADRLSLYGILQSHRAHQDSVFWQHTQMLILLEAGLLASARASTDWSLTNAILGASVILVSVLLKLLLFDRDDLRANRELMRQLLGYVSFTKRRASSGTDMVIGLTTMILGLNSVLFCFNLFAPWWLTA